MTGFIEGESRTQTTMFPESLDDNISEEPLPAVATKKRNWNYPEMR